MKPPPPEPPPPEPPPTEPPPRFQFGLNSIMLATLLAAVVMGILRWMGQARWYSYVAATYFMMLGLYVVLRVPSVWRVIRQSRRRLRELRAERVALAQKKPPAG